MQQKSYPNAVPPMLITPEQAALILGIGRTAVYQLIRQNELKSVKIGRTRRVVVTSLHEYVMRQLNGD